tara:strand:+ start:2564 stop:3463 length:900 start_codon:yes stop_codon:yes gene_type:complete
MTETVALLGAAGFVAPRHLQAIQRTDNRLVLAHDPHDSVGVLDSYFPEAEFLVDEEMFWSKAKALDVDWVVICSPNHHHTRQICRALCSGANVICEKPMALTVAELDQIAMAERKTGKRAYCVLQLRLHEAVMKLSAPPGRRRNVEVTYVTRRGPWYQESWKGDSKLSGGVAMNIGVHFFDLLIHLFGPVRQMTVTTAEKDHMRGVLALRDVDVRWFLSLRASDVPEGAGSSYRRLSIGDEVVDLSTGFVDLHTQVYTRIFAGEGFGVEDARPAIALVQEIRQAVHRKSKTWVQMGRCP